MSKKYPRVLIIGQYFDLRSGGGITMTNLFKGWDKDKIAVVAEDINNPDFSVCEQYYQLGSNESKKRFPFNLKTGFQNHSGPLSISSHHTKLTEPFAFPEVKKSMWYDLYITATGLVHYRNKLETSPQLLDWIINFSPDIIYTQLSTFRLIKFVSRLKEILNIPLAIHIMDDWPTTISMQQKIFFHSYWHNKFDKEFRNLLSVSSVLFSISESMSEEYNRRYGLKFQYFHNPIELTFWNTRMRTSYERGSPFRILYAGRIGTGLNRSLIDAAKAIENLYLKGLNVEFRIQSTTRHSVLKELKAYSCVRINQEVTYEELPGVFSDADLLLLPNDFDERSMRFLKFSMPTKASEYMISGSPILVYSSSDSAISKHAGKYKWAYLVTENNINKLEKAFEELYNNLELRKELGRRAVEYASLNFNGIEIRNNFRKSLEIG